MATNKQKYLLLAFIFLGITALLPAQNEPRLTQRFSWSGGEYSFRYEIVFEILIGNNYVFHLREFTPRRFIEVSLPVGDYRFRVIPRDILDKPSRASEWRNFKIIPRPEPEPEAEPELEFVPDYEPELEHDIEPEQEYAAETEPEPVIIFEPEPAVIAETQPEQEIAAEPETVKEPEEEKNPYALKPIIFNFGALVSMQFPLYGFELNENISLFSFGARISAIFALPLDIYIGPELTVNLYQFKKEYNLFFLAPGINFIALKWQANERIAFGVRLGAMYLYYNNSFSLEDIMPNIGVLFKWRFSPLFALDAGLDYYHLFRVAPGGYIRPFVSIGIQL